MHVDERRSLARWNNDLAGGIVERVIGAQRGSPADTKHYGQRLRGCR